jgi:SAM-dependent methyltransferase
MKTYSGKENLDVMHLAKNYNNTIFSWIISNCKHINKGRILDFGAGKGEFSNRYKDIASVEVDSSMHKFIKGHVETSISNYPKGCFDLVYSSNVLEHIEDDKSAIKEIYNALSEGGTVKILVPARMELYCNMDKSVGHYRRYSINEMKSRFSRQGFKLEYCRYFDFIGYFAALIYKVFINSPNIDQSSLVFYDKFIFPLSRILDILTFGKVIGKNIILKATK